MWPIRWLALAIVALGLLGSLAPVLAHDGEDDVAWVMLSGTSQADGHATLRVDVAEIAACDRLEPLRLHAVRSELEADGSLERVEACRFEGEIDLPEPGRWMLSARFAYDDREAEVWMPVGIADTAQEYERGDWLHAIAVEESSWSTGRMALLAGLGLVVGALATVAYQRLRPSSSMLSDRAARRR
jgi:hypothetical protein